jgi:hypothetical protein
VQCDGIVVSEWIFVVCRLIADGAFWISMRLVYSLLSVFIRRPK